MESVYHRGRSCSHYPVLFHVCMVYQPGEYMVDKTDLYALSVCHGGAVSDGNVHFVQDCKYAQTQYSMGDVYKRQELENGMQWKLHL